MRVTNQMAYNDFLTNLQTNTEATQKSMEQLSSLKEVNKSSDNPLIASKILDLTKSISQSNTYGQTIKDSISWANTQDGALDEVGKSMLRIRSLIQSSANGTMGSDELKANKAEMGQEIRAIVDSLNTNYDGRYVFSGQNTTTKPFVISEQNGEITGIAYQGTTSNLPREIASGVTVDLPTNGQVVMKEVNGESLSTFFGGLLKAVNEGSSEELSGKYLKNVDDYRNNLTNFRTQIGAVSNRLQAASDRNDTQQLQLKETLSSNQDVDIAQKYMEYQNQMTAYRATMAMGTKIMQTTILDYLR